MTNRLKLKRTLIAKLNTTDMVEQSKTHSFKHIFTTHDGKGNKAANIYFCFGSFYQILFKKQIKDTIDLGEGTSPKLALGLGSEKQDLSPYLIRLRSFRPYLEK